MLKRMVADRRFAEQHDLPLAAVADLKAARQEQVRTAGGIRRRDLLTAAGLIGASLALPRSARAAAPGAPRIAIIGGGIAGLACALKLADHGTASTVYEASDRIGGRMHSNVGYFDEGQTTEWCGELIDTNHKTIRALANRFGLDPVDLRAAEPNGSEDTLYFFGRYYPRAQADADFQPVYDALGAAIRAAGYPTTYNVQNDAGRALDRTSVYDWIEANVPGGHRSPMGAMLDVAYTEELAVDTRLQSSLNLIYLLGFQKHPQADFEMFGLSDERFHIPGGNQRLPEAIAASLGPDVIKRGWRLTAIRRTAAGAYNLDFDAGRTAQTITADRVVMAIPFSVLRTLDYSRAGFDALKDQTIRTLGAGKSGKLQLQFKSRLWSGTGPWPGVSNGNTYSDRGYQNSWEVTRGQGGTSGIINDYTGGPVSAAMATRTAYATANAPGVNTDARNFLTRIEPVFPGLPALWNGKVASSLPHLDPNLLLSYSHWELGQYSTIAGYEGVRQGNCLFAGEHTSVDFQGFMEGGAISGEAAAVDLLQRG